MINRRKWIISILSALVVPVVCFAQTDSVGVVGAVIVDAIEKLVGNNGTALVIYTVIIGAIGIVLRMLLKRLPVVMQGAISKIIWKVAAILFGSGVVLENNKDTDYLKRELTKKYPLLQIDVKKIKGV